MLNFYKFFSWIGLSILVSNSASAEISLSKYPFLKLEGEDALVLPSSMRLFVADETSPKEEVVFAWNGYDFSIVNFINKSTKIPEHGSMLRFVKYLGDGYVSRIKLSGSVSTQIDDACMMLEWSLHNPSDGLTRSFRRFASGKELASGKSLTIESGDSCTPF